MKVSYLKKVLRADLGTTFYEHAQSKRHDEPFSSGVQLQHPTQNHFPFSMGPWDNENELEDADEEMIFGEHIGDTPPIVELDTMADQDSKTEQKIESAHYLPKRTINVNDVDLHDTTEPNINIGRSDLMRRKEVEEDESGLQKIEDMIDFQKLKVKRVRPMESDRIPTVEVVKEDVIRVTGSNEFSSLSSVAQLVGTNSPSQELTENKQVQQLKLSNSQEEKGQIPSDIAKQGKAPRSVTFVKAIEVIQKPTSQQNMNVRFFTESLKKGKTQIDRITKDVVLINKKLDEHINKTRPKPAKPVLQPKRLVSHNVGGWSNLERNYIR